jgi:hypothetical protein
MDKLGAAAVPSATGASPGHRTSTHPGVRSPIRAPASKGHYNTTVQRGDPPMPRAVVVLAALAGLLALLWHLGWLPS